MRDYGMARRTIVLGAAGTGTSFALASRLKASWGAAVRIVGVDIFDARFVATSLLCDGFHTVPYANTIEYYDRVKEIIISEGAAAFIPILNEEIAQGDRFLKDDDLTGLDVWNNPGFAFLADKAKAEGWLRDIGIPSPYRPSRAELADSSDHWFVKPLAGTGSKGVLKRSGKDIVADDLIDDFIIQEVCDGPEVTVDSFYDADTGYGFAVCRERLETKAGVCTKARVFFDADISEIARRIGAGLGQRGTLCFQLMVSGGQWVVTDLNLRSGAGTALSCAAGYDVLSAAYACRSGQDYTRFFNSAGSADIYVVRQYAEFVTAKS